MPFRNIFPGVMMIVMGVFFLLDGWMEGRLMAYFWPVLLITAGILLVLKKQLSRSR